MSYEESLEKQGRILYFFTALIVLTVLGSVVASACSCSSSEKITCKVEGRTIRGMGRKYERHAKFDNGDRVYSGVCWSEEERSEYAREQRENRD